MKRRLASPHRPDSILNLLGKRVQASVSVIGWRLGGMTVGAQGDLRLFLLASNDDGSEGIELCWERGHGAGVAVPTFGGQIGPGRRSGPHLPQASELTTLVADTLAALPTADFDLLEFRSDCPESLPFDKQITSRLFGGWLVIGKTRWRGYLCTGMTQSFLPPKLSIAFESERGAHAVDLTPHLARTAAHNRPGGPLFTVAESSGSGETGPPAPGSPGAYVMFLIARRLAPGTRLLEEPALSVTTGATTAGRPPPWNWGATRGWRRFIHMDEVNDLVEVRRVLSGVHAELILGERECHNAHPCSYGPSLGAFDFPALEPWPDLYAGRLLASLVTEGQLVTGAGNLFEDMVETAGRTPGCKALIVADSCVSALLAEDADLLAGSSTTESAATAAETGENLLLRNEHFYDGLLAGRPRLSRPSSPAVNLVGFIPGPGREELSLLLAKCGIEVNAFFLPDIHLEQLDHFAAATCNVFYPVAQRASAYQAIERSTGLESLTIPSPHGREATRRWLAEIARGFGLEERAQLVAEEWLDGNRTRVDLVAQQAADKPVLMVVSELDLEYLLEPGRTQGIPILDAVEEMGFPVQILYYEEAQGKGGSKDETRRKTLMTRRPRPQLARFSKPDELEKLLLTSEARLVYSDAKCDGRVHKAGKNTFSLRHFEMGFEGALRSGRRLLRRARNPYFARFAVSGPRGDDA